MAGKGGGAWKVAYADFVTAMMAFFLVMWLVGQSKPVKQAIAQYFNDPMGTSSKPGKAKPGISADGGGPIPDAKGSTKIAVSRPTVDGPAKSDDGEKARKATLPALHDANKSTVGVMVLFTEDTTELDNRGRAVLDKLIPDLQGKLSKIELRGHASARPTSAGGNGHDPWQLSYARSMATLRYLVEKGIEPRRIRLSQSGIYEPAKIDHETAMPGRNSRVEVFDLNELAEDPTATREPRKKGPKKPERKRPAGPKAPAAAESAEG